MFRLGCAALIAFAIAFYLRQYFLGRRCKYTKNLRGKTVIVTGANSGIGLALVKQLAEKGATLIITCRDHQKIRKTANAIKKTVPNADIISKTLDLADFKSIKAFSQGIIESDQPIFALVNNAGIFYAKPEDTVDNFEVTFQTNFLGVFLLTILLLPLLRKSEQARIINLSSASHFDVNEYPQPDFHRKFPDTFSNRFKSYQYSKFCIVLFSYKLKALLQSTGVTVHCVDPGNVETNIYRNFPPLSNKFLYYLQKPIRIFIIRTPLEASQSVLFALLAPSSGFYIRNLQNTEEYNSYVKNPELADKLWQESRKICAEYLTSTTN